MCFYPSKARPHAATPRSCRWRRIVAGFVLLPLLYLLAAVAGALIASPPGATDPEARITLFVQSNGVHTAIVVPVSIAAIDWRALIDPRDFGGIEAGDHLSFGWGHRQFYLETPRWRDLKPQVAFRALTGSGGTLMHVEHLRAPRAGPDLRPFRVTAAQYHRLAAFILDGFDLPASGRPRAIPGYGPRDRFYVASGRYDLFRTSNSWTGAALRHAGVSMGIWTPFAQSIMWRFPAREE